MEKAHIAAAQHPSYGHDSFHGLAPAVTCSISCQSIQDAHICHGVQWDSSFLGLLHPVQGDTAVICVTAIAMSNWQVISCLLSPVMGAQES